MNDYTIKSVQTALSILKLFLPKNNELSFMEISRKTGLSKSTALRSVYTLKENGFSLHLEDINKYKLGSISLQLGLSALNSIDITKIAQPYMKELADSTELLCQLAIFENEQTIIILKILPPSRAKKLFRTRLASDVGDIMPSYCTGIGLLFLAQEEDEDIYKYLRNTKLIKYTSTTEIDIDKILHRIRKIREERYVINNGEYDEGIFSICYPVYNHTNQMVAGISLSGIREIVLSLDVEELISYTRKTALEISNELGYMLSI